MIILMRALQWGAILWAAQGCPACDGGSGSTLIWSTASEAPRMIHTNSICGTCRIYSVPHHTIYNRYASERDIKSLLQQSTISSKKPQKSELKNPNRYPPRSNEGNGFSFLRAPKLRQGSPKCPLPSSGRCSSYAGGSMAPRLPTDNRCLAGYPLSLFND